jgi:hypothetical protein
MPLVLSGDGITSDNITSLAASKLTGTLSASTFPSGSVVQTVVSCPAPNHVELGTGTWTEVSSSFRVSITPKNASNTLLIQCLFMFGGNNTSTISQFKIFDVTNNADVNLHPGEGSRTRDHGAARQNDADINDSDMMMLSTTVSAGSTNARTYGLYSRNEAGSTTLKMFFGNYSNTDALSIARPVFIVHEITA